MKKYILILVLIFVSAGLTSGDYFFYYQGKKMFMQRDDSYIAVKFKSNLSTSDCSAVLNQKIVLNAEKISYFSPGSSDSNYFMIQLKANTRSNRITSFRESLI